jgi:hypothetical protein
MSQNPLLTHIQKRGTSHQNAWKHGHYETYRLNFVIPAVHLREPKAELSRWFAVDEYDLSVRGYHHRYSLPKMLIDPIQNICLLQIGSIVNVGKASALFSHPGGGLQFELLPGSKPPVIMESHLNPKRVQY